MSRTFKIVSLCGSAGALIGYMQFLRSIPSDSGMAFVVLNHRRKDTHNQLVDILSHVTDMGVEEIVEGCRFEPNRVYVIPAGQDLTMDGDAFSLKPMTTVYGWPDVFDIYLRSVALATRDRAVTVIFSGMDKDGSASLEKLRRSGGTNYAQGDATTSSMPRHAIRTGMVDYVGSPKEIAALILDLPAFDKFLPI